MTQRTWFITGVNSGFGRHMTEQLLERGERVAGTVRKMDSMNDLKANMATSLKHDTQDRGEKFSSGKRRRKSNYP